MILRALLCAALVGCGTTTFYPGDAAREGSTDASSEATTDAADSGDPCAQARLQIDIQKKQLQQCNPTSGGSCMNLIMDACCPFSTTVDNTTIFQGLVSQYKSMCTPFCPNMCPAPQKTCLSDGMGGGVCH